MMLLLTHMHTEQNRTLSKRRSHIRRVLSNRNRIVYRVFLSANTNKYPGDIGTIDLELLNSEHHRSMSSLCLTYLVCANTSENRNNRYSVCQNCVNCGVDLETIHSNTLDTRTDPIENAMLKNFSSTTATTTTTTTTNYCTVLYGILVQTFK